MLKIIGAAVAALAVGALAGGSAEAAGKKLTIALIPGLTTDAFYITMHKGAQAAADALGDTLVFQGASDFNPVTQVPVLDAVIARHPDAILIAPTDKVQLVQPLKSAVDAGTSLVLYAQGGADIDVTKTLTKHLPPFLLSRAAVEKLAAGKSVSVKTLDGQTAKLDGAMKGTARVRVGEQEQVVAVLQASGEEAGEFTVLEDPEWPLVLERRESECFWRLVSLRLGVGESPAKPVAAPPAAATASTGARRFEFQDGTSAKFWEIAVEGASFTVRYGKLGTLGTAQTKTFGSPAEAAKEADKLVHEKTKKGYSAV